MGGVKFFTVTLEEPEANKDLMYAALEGANQEPNPEEGELKGGAKELGKLLLSYNTEKVAMLCHVPDVLAEKLTADDWVANVTKIVGGDIVETKAVDGGK